MHRSTIVTVVAVLLSIPLAASAQTDLAARTGQRVRVRIETGPLHARTTIGTVAGVSDDSLFLRTSRGKRLIGFETGEISSLELSQAQKSHLVAGLLLGAGAGLALGLAARPSPPRGGTDCSVPPGDIAPFDAALTGLCGVAVGLGEESVRTARAALPVLGTLAGGAMGALLGSRVKSDRWVPAVLPEASPAGAELGVRWTFPTTR